MNDAEGSVWPAPAKLNLFLHITGRRHDGYHTLQTVFQLVDWGDTIRLRLRDDDEITRQNALADVPLGDDLCVRAARLLKRIAARGPGVDIDIQKRIPIGGGLGGGSSDAATVLVALNALWDCGLDIDSLADAGLQLGADVPVFVRGHTAFAEGVGERLTPINLPERTYVIVDPGVHVRTGELFQSSELTRDSPDMTISRFLAGEITCNAFQELVRRRYPPVQRALSWLSAVGAARLSGSGACVFIELEHMEQGAALLADVPADLRAVVARGVNRSPLIDALEQWRQTGKTGFDWDVAKR